VRLVLKNMVVHPQLVMMAHVAGCAAAKQGKFKEFFKAFWTSGYKPYQEQREERFLGQDNALKIAADVGVDIARLQADVPACQRVIDADEEELRKFKVNGTPAFFINGEFVGGGIPKEAFKQLIDQKLAVAERSGVPAAEYYDKEIRGKGEKSVERPRGSSQPKQR
jgi:protein-disulfide isomerase